MFKLCVYIRHHLWDRMIAILLTAKTIRPIFVKLDKHLNWKASNAFSLWPLFTSTFAPCEFTHLPLVDKVAGLCSMPHWTNVGHNCKCESIHHRWCQQYHALSFCSKEKIIHPLLYCVRLRFNTFGRRSLRYINSLPSLLSLKDFFCHAVFVKWWHQRSEHENIFPSLIPNIDCIYRAGTATRNCDNNCSKISVVFCSCSTYSLWPTGGSRAPFIVASTPQRSHSILCLCFMTLVLCHLKNKNLKINISCMTLSYTLLYWFVPLCDPPPPPPTTTF